MSALSPRSALRSMAAFMLRSGLGVSSRVRQKLKLRHCVVGTDTVLLDSSRIHNFLARPDAITVGDHCRIAGQLLVNAHGGRIRIGTYCYIGEGARIWSAASVDIGDRVLISHGVNVHDFNAHSTSAALRHRHIVTMYAEGHPEVLPDVAESPIVIEDDVWIGFNATVLKGVRLGKGAIVAAASVVTRDVSPYTVVGGNPARPIGASRP